MCAPQPEVLTTTCSTPRRLERLDGAPGERERGVVLARVRVQRAAAGLRARGHDLEAVARQDARGRAVVRAEDRLLDAAGEQTHAPAPRALARRSPRAAARGPPRAAARAAAAPSAGSDAGRSASRPEPRTRRRRPLAW